MSELPKPIDILPHRDPMLFLSEVTELIMDESDEVNGAIGFWQLTGEEQFFAGHFPNNPVVPGFFQAEALAQLGAYAGLHIPRYAGKLTMLRGAEKVVAKSIVRPGDRLDLRIDIVHKGAFVGRSNGIAKVGDRITCSVTNIGFAAVDPETIA